MVDGATAEEMTRIAKVLGDKQVSFQRVNDVSTFLEEEVEKCKSFDDMMKLTKVMRDLRSFGSEGSKLCRKILPEAINDWLQNRHKPPCVINGHYKVSGNNRTPNHELVRIATLAFENVLDKIQKMEVRHFGFYIRLKRGRVGESKCLIEVPKDRFGTAYYICADKKIFGWKENPTLTDLEDHWSSGCKRSALALVAKPPSNDNPLEHQLAKQDLSGAQSVLAQPSSNDKARHSSNGNPDLSDAQSVLAQQDYSALVNAARNNDLAAVKSIMAAMKNTDSAMSKNTDSNPITYPTGSESTSVDTVNNIEDDARQISSSELKEMGKLCFGVDDFEESLEISNFTCDPSKQTEDEKNPFRQEFDPPPVAENNGLRRVSVSPQRDSTGHVQKQSPEKVNGESGTDQGEMDNEQEGNEFQGGEYYPIEDIHSCRRNGTEREYLVQWANHDDDDTFTWEPAENIGDKDKLNDFNSKYRMLELTVIPLQSQVALS